LPLAQRGLIEKRERERGKGSSFMERAHRTFLAANAAWHLKGDIKYVNKNAGARHPALLELIICKLNLPRR